MSIKESNVSDLLLATLNPERISPTLKLFDDYYEREKKSGIQPFNKERDSTDSLDENNAIFIDRSDMESCNFDEAEEWESKSKYDSDLDFQDENNTYADCCIDNEDDDDFLKGDSDLDWLDIKEDNAESSIDIGFSEHVDKNNSLDSEVLARAGLLALEDAHVSIKSLRDERARQAKLTFNIALFLMTIGALIIFIGVGFVLINNNLESGIITTASGAVSEVISALVFALNKETNNRLDEIRKEVAKIEVAKVGLILAKEIVDIGQRDKTISTLTMQLQQYA